MKIPLFPLDVVLFPGASLPLHIFEDRYREMMAECIDQQSEFGVVRAQRGGLAVAGCTAGVARVLERYPDGRLDVLCEGRRRFEIEQLDESRSFLQAEVDYFDDEAPLDSTRDQRAACVAMHAEVMELAGVGQASYSLDLDREVSFQLAWELPADLGFKQQLLTNRSDKERTALLLKFYEIMLPKLQRGAGARAHSSNGNGRVM